MNYRTAYIRRSRQGLRIKKRAAAVVILGIAACAALLLQGGAPGLESMAQDGTAAQSAVAAFRAGAVPLRVAGTADAGAARRVYRYSVVPGGVASRAELAHIVRADKVVAAHYASFEVDKSHAVTVAKPRAVYVSYRKGDQVYWTAKKVMLAEGETVLSDGKSDIRGRCGNRISDVPRMPVEARGPGEELDETEGPVEVAYAFDGAAGGGAHQLTYFADGAGQLAVSGGVPAQARASGFASIPGGFYPSGLYGTPTTVVSPANERASTGGSSSDPGDAPTDTTASTPVPNPLPVGGTGSTPPAPVGLPDRLGDTDQPIVDVDVKPPAVPGTVLWPVDLPSVPVKPVDTIAEAPEPATLWLGGIGFGVLLLMRRRPRRVS
jgi:hypothetical protein